jgi:hypothetical protein
MPAYASLRIDTGHGICKIDSMHKDQDPDPQTGWRDKGQPRRLWTPPRDGERC